VCGKKKRAVKGKVNKYCSKQCADKGKTLPRDEHKRRWYERVKKYRKENPEKYSHLLKYGIKFGHVLSNTKTFIEKPIVRFFSKCVYY